jgi:hypothetical protein
VAIKLAADRRSCPGKISIKRFENNQSALAICGKGIKLTTSEAMEQGNVAVNCF